MSRARKIMDDYRYERDKSSKSPTKNPYFHSKLDDNSRLVI